MWILKFSNLSWHNPCSSLVNALSFKWIENISLHPFPLIRFLTKLIISLKWFNLSILTLEVIILKNCRKHYWFSSCLSRFLRIRFHFLLLSHCHLLVWLFGSSVKTDWPFKMWSQGSVKIPWWMPKTLGGKLSSCSSKQFLCKWHVAILILKELILKKVPKVAH